MQLCWQYWSSLIMRFADNFFFIIQLCWQYRWKNTYKFEVDSKFQYLLFVLNTEYFMSAWQVSECIQLDSKSELFTFLRKPYNLLIGTHVLCWSKINYINNYEYSEEYHWYINKNKHRVHIWKFWFFATKHLEINVNSHLLIATFKGEAFSIKGVAIKWLVLYGATWATLKQWVGRLYLTIKLSIIKACIRNRQPIKYV